MTVVSNDPIWWPEIENFVVYNYFTLASAVVILYDWALTFGQEHELIWKQRFSLMTVLYISVRYSGIFISFLSLISLPSLLVTDVGCVIMNLVANWVFVIANAVLGVIVIIRLHAMYQQSRRLLICLVVIFLGIQVPCGVFSVMESSQIVEGSEALILSGYYICTEGGGGTTGSQSLNVSWILGTVWEVLALCLAILIAVKHFLELRRHLPSTGSIVEDCFTVLIKTHLFYFAAFAAASALYIGQVSPMISQLGPVASGFYSGVVGITEYVQVFVLGPRLILGVREYHAKLVADSDLGTAMTSIAFQEHIHISTGSHV